MIKNIKWNRCNICGRFISYKDFVNGKAVNKLITPSSLFTDESYDIFHIKCNKEAKNE